MKIKEMLTIQQKIDLIDGRPTGFMSYILKEGDTFYNILPDLVLGYYTQRSGEKPISPTYEAIIDIVKNSLTETRTVDEVLGTLIRIKFIDKWNKVYESLTAEYNPLHDKEYVETRNADNLDTNAYNSTITDDGNSSIKEVTTNTGTTKDDIYGFNSTNPVGDNVSTDDYTETTEGSKDDNTTHNLRTKGGSDTVTRVVDETINKSGRDTSASELVDKEIELRMNRVFFDIIYDDVDSITTLSIYI